MMNGMMNSFFKRPFVVLLIPLIVGITMAYNLYSYISHGEIIAISILIPLLILGIGLFPRWHMMFIGLAVLLIGGLLYKGEYRNISPLKDIPLEEYGIIATVIKEPIQKDYYWRVDIKINEVLKGDYSLKVNEKALLQIYNTSGEIPYNVGTTIHLNKIHRYTLIKGNDITGYHLYLKTKGINHILGVNSINISISTEGNNRNLLNQSLLFKRYAENIFDTTLGRNEGSLMKSMVFGNQGYLSEDIIRGFSKTGTAHIIAISGLHVGIIILFLEGFFSIFRINKNKSIIFILSILLIYAYITGFPISIIRAIAMYATYITAYYLHRPYDSINSLAAIAFLLLLFNPITLFSVSFQLSFAATLSIILFYPIIIKLTPFLPTYFSKLLAVSIGAQLGTWPIIAFHFNQISVVAILSNLLIVPLLGLLLTLAFTSLIIGFIYLELAVIMNKVTNALLTYMLGAVRITGGFRFSHIALMDISIGMVIIYYFILTAGYMYMIRLDANTQEVRNNDLSTADNSN